LARLVESAHNGCRIVGYVPAEDLSPAADAGAHPPRPLAETCRRLGADVVVMADNLPPEADGLLGQAILCLQRGIQVTGVASFVEESFRKVPVELIGPDWLVRANLHLDRPYLFALKRGCDLCAAALGLALTLPFWPLFALLVTLTSRGPAFYRQTRVGRFGRPFTICKFRTMRLDAESDGRARWAETNDPRVTSVGRIFRKTRVDELPQLWNILRGDMSFVGPRPERPEFVEHLSSRVPCYSWRHLARPGLTGWAQIAFRYGASMEDAREKHRYDLYYVKHVNFSLDLYIFLRTIASIVQGSR
ncbi:MAG: exopolysaccharide biosynthesis polyprenyl glycosylphosphotransferase, partial [Planctomycetota bacterium]